MQIVVAVLVSGVVALFGVTSAVLGFMAEAKRLTPDEIHVSGFGRQCVYPANPAHTLGICAILLLVAAQIIVSAAGGCCGCCKPPGYASHPNSITSWRRVVGVVASVLSWVAALIAVFYYCVATTLNAPRMNKCYLFKGGIFLRAAVLSLVATLLGIVSCVLLRLSAAAKDAPPPEQGQHAVGLPQCPVQGYGQEACPSPAQGYGGQAPNRKLVAQSQKFPVRWYKERGTWYGDR